MLSKTIRDAATSGKYNEFDLETWAHEAKKLEDAAAAGLRWLSNCNDARAENEVLEKTIDAFESHHVAETADLDAEIAKLREALEKNMAWVGRPPTDKYSFDNLREEAWALGKKALHD